MSPETSRNSRQKVGHYWRRGATIRGTYVVYMLVQMHRVEGRGPAETAWTLPREVSVELSTCARCGLLLADGRHWDREQEQRVGFVGYGVDVDALAVSGSAPTCEPFALSRAPHALVEGEAA